MVAMAVSKRRSFIGFYTMLQIYAHRFVTLNQNLAGIENEIRSGEWIELDLNTQKANGVLVGAFLRSIMASCDELDLVSSKKQVREILKIIGPPSTLTFDGFANMMAELRRRIVEDMEDRVFFSVDPHRISELFKRIEGGELEGELTPKDTEEMFGAALVKSFPSAMLDMEESCRCLITSRHTACVFHCMRIMEVGLRALGKSLTDPALDPKRNPSWESILAKCDKELEKPARDRCADWQSDDRFYSEAIANLRAVKNAWRNPTMHVEIHYDDERARDVWRTVRAFMRHLSVKLHE